MRDVYMYVLDTMADWEIAHVTAELRSGRFFSGQAQGVRLVFVGACMDPVTTMGGLTATPEALVRDIPAGPQTMLLLPGANTWGDPANTPAVAKAAEVLAAGGTVCAICGATAALAAAGLLDERPHTSNGAGFLEATVPGYRGSGHYVDAPCVDDGGLVTAAGTGALPWARQIIGRLGVFTPEALESWYGFYTTGEARYFFELMQGR